MAEWCRGQGCWPRFLCVQPMTNCRVRDWVMCYLLSFFSPSQKWNVLIRNKISSIHQLSKREFTGYQLFVNKFIHVHPHKIKLVCIRLMARSSCDGHDASNQWYGSRRRCKSDSCLTIDDVDARRCWRGFYRIKWVVYQFHRHCCTLNTQFVSGSI